MTVRVAIDGPAGAGKSTVARAIADRMGFVLVDTGAIYRAVALAARRAQIGWDQEVEVTALAEALARGHRIAFERVPGRGVRVMLDGEDVSEAIRAPDMSLGASRVSAIGGVRTALLDLQRQAGGGAGVVLEGRDIGTVVFPDAEVKFFLTAPSAERAQRRHDELRQKGAEVSYEETLVDVERRDRADSQRVVAPLRQAEDAIVIDSSGLSIDEVVETMVRHIERIATR